MATVPLQITPTQAKHVPSCCCPTCRGLVPRDRPVFGAGQVLTAADLTALQDYVRAKNRLHSRYLHGWGVVCGLEVTCNDCEGSVTIGSGYALDPCGEDIIVAQPVRFDIVSAIRACNDQKRAKTGDCDPWMPPPDPGCTDAESHWCVALKYREVETAFTQGLVAGRPAAACGCGAAAAGSCSGGCGCSGASGCGCGCGGVVKAMQTATVMRSSNTSCSPRRILECYDITAIPSKEGCTPPAIQRGRDGVAASPLGTWDQFIPKGTLLRNILDCIANDIQEVSQRLKTGDGALLAQVFTLTDAQLATAQVQPAAVYSAFCAFKAAVMAELAEDTHPTRCAMRRAAEEIVLAPPEPNMPAATFFDSARDAVRDLFAVWLQLIIDCICHAFLPQCDDDPCDDRVEIACVTIKAGKILSICNHSCRRYAGAFPSTVYWLSIVPILPLITRALANLCCRPDLLRKNSPLVNDLMPLLDKVDPTGNLRRAVVANDFALPKTYLARLAGLGEVPLMTRLARTLDIAGATTSYTGTSEAQARAALSAAGAKVEVQPVAATDEARLIAAMEAQPLIRSGDAVKVYTRDGKVVATVLQPAAPAVATGADHGAEVAALRSELAALKETVAGLTAARPVTRARRSQP